MGCDEQISKCTKLLSSSKIYKFVSTGIVKAQHNCYNNC